MGFSVYAGTILENGTLQVVAEKLVKILPWKIIELVEEAQDSKSAAEKLLTNFLNIIHQ